MKEALDTHELETPFAFGERFELQRQLGRGGMGIVYRAYDRERRTDVALKVLPRMDPGAMYGMKQEFRALTDVTHPNLVVLHELIATADQWFFTMELIEGVDLVEWVCGPDPQRLHGLAEQSGETRREVPPSGAFDAALTVTLQEGRALEPREPLTEQSPSADAGGSVPPPPVRGRTRADVGRLRAALGQLTAAISAIHEARKLHLDLKPANVMVRDDGRVVVLDFGLVRDMPLDVERATGDADVRGTPAYMAPEQARGEHLTPAADWYALGAILFRVLTGKLLSPVHHREPPAPGELVDGVPDDLSELCVALLRRDPRTRAAAADVMRCVSAGSSWDTSAAPPTPTVGRQAPFVGREAQLRALHAAFVATRKGQPVVVYLGGRSGMGKTALATQLVTELRRAGAALVLSGRCYERESVPFKALDSVIDALADYLKRLPRATAAGLLPRGIHELGRLFPALRQVEAITDVPQRTLDISDDGERRRRAFAALKELLARLVDTGPLVLFIDDLQWGDLDSARLLAEVLGPPDPPALLLLGTYRTEEARWSDPLAELLDLGVEEVRRLEVLPLTEPEACDLASALLGGTEPDALRRAAAVAVESEGSPLFVLELARHVAAPAGAHRDDASSLSLEEVLHGRFERLSPDAQRFLEVVAVAGGPVEQGVAARAAELTTDPLTSLAALRAGHFVRTRGTREVDDIETYHDRIRETIVRHVAPERLARHHLRLAVELEATGRADAEVLAAHFLAVGRHEEAGRYFLAGASHASAALAFDKAARLYRQAIDLGAGGPERRRELLTELGFALRKSGRGREAALAFQEAAEGAPPDDVIALKHAAAEQFLISGHVDDGMDLLREVLRAVELPLPGTPRRALLALLSRRAHLRLRGLKFRPRDAAELPRATLRQIDICFSAALGLSVVDWIYGASFQALQLLLALSAGEPSRIALGLAFEAGHVGCAGGPTRRRTLELVEAAEALSSKLDDPGAEGFTRLMKGVAEWGVGRFQTGLEYTTQAEQILRERCTGVTWQIDTAQVFSMICMTSLGDLHQLSQRHPVWLKEARERGDLYATTTLRTFWGASTLLALAADQPEYARLDVEDAMSGWSRRGYHPQHYYALLSRTLVDLYRGDHEEAYGRISKAWPELEGSLLLRVQGLAITAHYVRGSAALAAAAGTPGRELLLRSAAEDALALTKTRVEWSQPLSQMLLAGAAAIGGGAGKARSLLESAALGFDGSHMALHAAAARHALGGVVGGQEGHATRAAAVHFMTSQKITRPGVFASMLAPGFQTNETPS